MKYIYKMIEIDNKFYQDISEIIKRYVFGRCYRCDDIFDCERDYEITSRDKLICNYCINKYDFKRCYKCYIYYDYYSNDFCRSCLGSCKVYCFNCIFERDRRPSYNN